MTAPGKTPASLPRPTVGSPEAPFCTQRANKRYPQALPEDAAPLGRATVDKNGWEEELEEVGGKEEAVRGRLVSACVFSVTEPDRRSGSARELHVPELATALRSISKIIGEEHKKLEIAHKKLEDEHKNLAIILEKLNSMFSIGFASLSLD